VHCDTDGGAIFAVFPGDLLINETRFVKVSCAANGGVIFFHGHNISISKSCFTECAGALGFVVFCARSLDKTFFESNHFLECEGKHAALWLFGFTIDLLKLNTTAMKAASAAAFFAQPTRDLSYADQIIVDNSGDTIFQFEDIVPGMTIERGSFFRNNAVSSLILLVSYDLVVIDWWFKENGNVTLIVNGQNANSAQFKGCVFDMEQSGLSDWVSFPDSKFEGGEDKKIAEVQTVQCWVQKRYVFEEPVLYKKVAVGVVFGLLFIAGVIYVLVDGYRDREKQREREAEAEQNYMRNEEAFGFGRRGRGGMKGRQRGRGGRINGGGV
jgi:hypothetical protein